MTLEQTEQWKAAITDDGEWEAMYAMVALLPKSAGPPLDSLGDLVQKKLLGDQERLTNWGVPCWAMSLWYQCAHWGWQQKQPWVPEFIRRSEAALIGLQILYPDRDLAEPVYGRLLLRFLHEVYQPLAEWIRQGASRPRRPVLSWDFERLVIFQELCGRWDAPDPTEWQELRKRIWDYTQSKAYSSLRDVYRCIEIAQVVLWGGHEWWWKATGDDLAQRILNEYTTKEGQKILRLQGKTSSIEHVADAFLIALEAERPAPNWLPGK